MIMHHFQLQSMSNHFINILVPKANCLPINILLTRSILQLPNKFSGTVMRHPRKNQMPQNHKLGFVWAVLRSYFFIMRDS